MYDGTLDDECPVHGSAVSFKIGDYLHIFEKFDANWWVGRKVKENCDIGFIPSPDRLEQLILQKAPVGKLDRQKAGCSFRKKVVKIFFIKIFEGEPVPAVPAPAAGARAGKIHVINLYVS